jgi:hypothetical protein
MLGSYKVSHQPGLLPDNLLPVTSGGYGSLKGALHNIRAGAHACVQRISFNRRAF